MIAWLLVACAGPQAVDGPPVLLGGPHVVEPERTPLVRQVLLTADRPVEVTGRVIGPERTLELVPSGPAEAHALPVLDLRADRSYTLDLELVDDAGRTSTVSSSFDTRPLPAKFPDIEVIVHEPERMEPGRTLVSLRAGRQDGGDYLIALESSGEISWWYRAHGQVSDARLVGDRMLFVEAGAIVELDWLGTLLGRWVSLDDGGGGILVDHEMKFHHEVAPTDEGFLTLSWARRDVEAYPSTYQAALPRSAAITDAIVLDLDRDGSILRSTSLAEILDDQRIGYDSLAPSAHEWLDWGHANAVVEHGPLVVASLRHQDTVAAFERSTGALAWILANPAGWGPEHEPFRLQPVGEVRWPYHQHAPELRGDRLLLFDNGNYRASPLTDEEPTDERSWWSRAVEYRIDEAAGTVEEVWSYDETSTGRLYSSLLGDADHLEQTGNVLITYGAVSREAGVPVGVDGSARFEARLVEVDRATDEEVWHVRLSLPASVDPAGWMAYRAERLPE